MRPYLVRVHTQPPAAQPLDVCIRGFERAADLLVAMDPQIVSVGIARMPGGYGYRVLRWRPPGVCALTELGAAEVRAGVWGVPFELREAAAPLRPLVELSASSIGPGASQAMVPEQGHHRPVCAGLQLQNHDCDQRMGLLAAGRMEVGSLGMVFERGGETFILSNNHVLAGQNRGQLGDRIAQPGGLQLGADEVVARLERIVRLEPSPANAHPRFANVVWNRVDAALAKLRRGLDWQPGFLVHHRLPPLGRHATPMLGESVFKVGRTTGLRRGRVLSVGDRVGPIPYAVGDCWFRGSFVVECEDGRAFSAPGDSGAAVVRDSGEVLGLVYAGNGVQTFACPITEVFAALDL